MLTHPISHNHYRTLPTSLYAEGLPERLVSPQLLELNRSLLARYGQSEEWFTSEDGLETLAGLTHAPDNPPVALGYAGHQFGQWVPQLGDGRAHMLGQLRCGDGTTVDVQLKGSGRTRYSRGGDGRATLGAVLREHLVSECMAGLGIPTTRSLAVIGTGATVMRQTAEPGALLVRTAASHVRVGSFQFAAQQDQSALRALADFIIDTHFDACRREKNPYGALLDQIITRQAELIAKWMLVGFIHGVMNTDNMSLVGETIDYGPCAFVDDFHPRKVFSSIDRMGRYAWNQQPSAGLWNLTQLAQTMLPLWDTTPEQATADVEHSLDRFGHLFEKAFQQGFADKMGIVKSPDIDISPLIQSTFDLMTEQSLDFTVFFDRLTLAAEQRSEAPLHDLFDESPSGQAWIDRWTIARDSSPASLEVMRQANPRIIARNHRVEQAIERAYKGDFSLFRRLCQAYAEPYALNDDTGDLAKPPRPNEVVQATYCGT